MNRRTYLKSIVALGTLVTVSFSVFKWFDLNMPVNPDSLWNKRPIILELAELIIPRTDTPGAKDAALDVYIINVLIHCNTAKQQHKFYYGIKNLEEFAVRKYGKEFLACNKAEMYKILEYSASQASYSYNILRKIDNRLFGEPFFLKLKELTIEGYCLSKPGATAGLAYDYIPGNFQGCIPMGPNQKSWATK